MESRFYFTAPNQISNEKEVDFVVNMVGLTDCAAVLLPQILLQKANQAILQNLTQKLQNQEIAVLAQGNTNLLTKLGLDGVEFYAKDDQLKDQLSKFDEDLILGFNCLKSKHDAMSYGEMDAHYVAFKPIDEYGDNQPTIGENQYMIDLALWWEALFSIPAIAYLDFDQNIDNLDFSNGYPEFIAIMPNFWLNDAPQQQLEKLIKKLN